MIILPAATAMSAGISGDGSSVLFETQAAPTYVYGHGDNGTVGIPFANSFTNTSTSTTITDSYVKTVGNNTSIAYYNPVTILTNITVEDLNLHSANKYVEQIQASGNVTGILGYGNSNGNSSFTFTPLEQANITGNSTEFVNMTFKLGPAQLAGNQSVFMMVQLNFTNSTTTVTVNGYAIGNKNAGPWYAVGLNAGYVGGGILLMVFGFLSLPFHDLSISRMQETVRTTRKRRPTATRKRTRRRK